MGDEKPIPKPTPIPADIPRDPGKPETAGAVGPEPMTLLGVAFLNETPTPTGTGDAPQDPGKPETRGIKRD